MDRLFQTAIILKAAHRTLLVLLLTISAEPEVDFDDHIADFNYISTLYGDILLAESLSNPILGIKCGTCAGETSTRHLRAEALLNSGGRSRVIDLLSRLHRTQSDLAPQILP